MLHPHPSTLDSPMTAVSFGPDRRLATSSPRLDFFSCSGLSAPLSLSPALRCLGIAEPVLLRYRTPQQRFVAAAVRTQGLSVLSACNPGDCGYQHRNDPVARLPCPFISRPPAKPRLCSAQAYYSHGLSDAPCASQCGILRDRARAHHSCAAVSPAAATAGSVGGSATFGARRKQASRFAAIQDIGAPLATPWPLP